MKSGGDDDILPGCTKGKYLNGGSIGSIHEYKLSDEIKKLLPEELRDKEWVLKINEDNLLLKIALLFHSSEEPQMLARNYPTFRPVYRNHKKYIVTKLIKGKPISSSDIEELSFKEKLKFLNLLSLKLKELHAKGIVHGDLHRFNVHAEFKDKNIINVFILDFGLSFSCDNVNKLSQRALPLVFSNQSRSIPPEFTRFGRYGMKSDIYHMAVICEEIFLNLEDIKKDLNEISNINLYEILLSFIKKMGNHNYDDRPEVNEIVDFFTIFENLYAISEIEKSNNNDKHHKETLSDLKKELIAKLILIDVNLWNDPIQKKNKLTWQEFNFKAYPGVGGKIIDVFKSYGGKKLILSIKQIGKEPNQFGDFDRSKELHKLKNEEEKNDNFSQRYKKYLELLGLRNNIKPNKELSRMGFIYIDAIRLFGDYCSKQTHSSQQVQGLARFFKGHWNHRHIKTVENVLREYDPTGLIAFSKHSLFGLPKKNSTLEDMLYTLRIELLKANKRLKPNGELTKRIQFIQKLTELNVIDVDQFCNENNFQELRKRGLKLIKVSVNIDINEPDALFIVGEHPSLGRWENALRMELKNNQWMIEIPEDAVGQFKFLVGPNMLGGHAHVSNLIWEPGDNRQLVGEANFTIDKNTTFPEKTLPNPW